MLHSAFEALWFYLPALGGNFGVYVVCTLMGEDIQIDLYRTIRGRKILGSGRTLLGVMGFLVFSVLIGIAQHRVVESIYLGLGACFGCLVNSLIKRILGLSRGAPFFPIDQTDHVLGASLFYCTGYSLDLKLLCWGLCAGFLIHFCVNLLRSPWERLLGVSDKSQDLFAGHTPSQKGRKDLSGDAIKN
jgi:hypothetical protein